MKLPLRGACQCGKIQFEIRAEPLSVWACHCTDCQKQTGAAFALSMPVPRDSVVVTAGTPSEWLRTADSGRTMMCVFCPDCGARLWHHPTTNQAIAVVKPGTLDDTSWLYPVAHIWTKSAQPWVDIPDNGLCFETNYPDVPTMTAAWKAHLGQN